ncbi:MAG: histidine phosphatase family protein [Gaiellaceae bacterium]
MLTTMLLARHGETDWNAERRFQGHADPQLNERGVEQARELARTLAEVPLDAVYASDLRRASETARIAVEGRRLRVHELRELREVDVGEWSGLSAAEIEQRDPEGLRRWRHGETGWRDGESFEQMRERIVPALRALAGRHPGGRLLVVSHGAAIRAVLAHARGVSYSEHRRLQPAPTLNCAIYPIVFENGDMRQLD